MARKVQTPKAKSVADLLKKKAAKPSAKKPSMPTVSADAGMVKQWLDGKAMKTDGEALMKMAEEALVAEVEPRRLDLSMDAGAVVSSVKVNGKVTMTTKNAYCRIDPEHLPKLQKVFGDRADGFFVERTVVTLTEAAFADEDFLAAIMAAVPSGREDEYLHVSNAVVPTEAFHTARNTDQTVAMQATHLMDEGIVKPYRPAFRA